MTTNSSLHIITVATDIKYYMPYLIESIKKNNNELTILGLNMKWLGFNWRYKIMREHLSKLPEDDIVCFCDGYDVLCLRDLNELINEFNRIITREYSKIICCDDLTFRRSKYLSGFFFKCNPWAHDVINGGFYMGRVKDIKNMLYVISTYSTLDNMDDQMLINIFNEKNPGVIYIDKYCEIFYTICKTKQDLSKFIKFNNNKIYTLYNTRPFFIHAAFYGYLDNIIIKLGYNYDYNNRVEDSINNIYSNSMVKKNIFMIVYFIYIYKIKILLFLVLFIFILKTIKIVN